jgi:hypothetical protein
LLVRLHECDSYATDFTFKCERVSLDAFDSPEEAARAYIAAAWMFGWPKRKLNFLDVKSKQEFEFLAREEEKEHRLAMWQLTTH